MGQRGGQKGMLKTQAWSALQISICEGWPAPGSAVCFHTVDRAETTPAEGRTLGKGLRVSTGRDQGAF